MRVDARELRFFTHRLEESAAACVPRNDSICKSFLRPKTRPRRARSMASLPKSLRGKRTARWPSARSELCSRSAVAISD